MALGVEALARMFEPVLEAQGLVLYRLGLEGQGAQRRLELVVDRADKSQGGVSLDELTRANHELSALLDLEDPVDGRYRLVVESPGIERVLRTVREFVYAVGERVRVKLRHGLDGVNVFEGELREADESEIMLLVGSKEVKLALHDIKVAQTVYVWPETRQSGRKVAEKEGE